MGISRSSHSDVTAPEADGPRSSDIRRASAARRLREDHLRSCHAVLVELSRSRTLGTGDRSQAFHEITRAACTALDVERVGIWLFDEARQAIFCEDLYERSADRHTKGTTLRAADHPAYFAALEENRTLAVTDARCDPRTEAFTESYLVPVGITSLLDAPIRVGGELIGVVCHEHVGPARTWTLEEQVFAGSMADFAALAVQEAHRRDSEEKIRASERRLRQIIDLVPHMIFAKDRDGVFLLANRALADAFGTSVEELRGRSHASMHTGEEAAQMLADDAEVLERGCPKFIPAETLTDADGVPRTLQTIKIPYTESGTNEPAVLGVAVDITERQRAEELQTLMLRELDHRVKNNLTSVLAIADQTAAVARDLPEFMESFGGRLRSMAIAHEMLSQTRWEGAWLREMVHRIVAPHPESRFTIDGEDLVVPASVAPPLCMILHELVTNAAKYGALSSPEGRVVVKWIVRGDEADTGQLELEWVERDGPRVKPPARRGIGSELIEDMVSYQLHGRGGLEFPPEGARCELHIPLPERETGGRESRHGQSP